MSEVDRRRWDERYSAGGTAAVGPHGPPQVWADFEAVFPTEGYALELACGRGQGAVWLAGRGLDVWGVDVSPVAIDFARELATLNGVDGKCRFEVFDLDGGLPQGPAVDLLYCYKFRDPRLHRDMIERLRPGGLLAVAVLSEVGQGPGAFRARSGELHDAFSRDHLDVLHEGEGESVAWMLARRQ
ncbi:MAG: methyltransferase domain-containing protein [Acidobacteria bacterium]|nr:methyltransferase domain-containing protein [Acidobacteriota bacterium]